MPSTLLTRRAGKPKGRRDSPSVTLLVHAMMSQRTTAGTVRGSEQKNDPTIWSVPSVKRPSRRLRSSASSPATSSTSSMQHVSRLGSQGRTLVHYAVRMPLGKTNCAKKLDHRNLQKTILMQFVVTSKEVTQFKEQFPKHEELYIIVKLLLPHAFI